MKAKHIIYFTSITVSLTATLFLSCYAQTQNENTLTWRKKGSPSNGLVKEITINNEYAGCYTWINNTATIHDPNKVPKENCNTALLSRISGGH